MGLAASTYCLGHKRFDDEGLVHSVYLVGDTIGRISCFVEFGRVWKVRVYYGLCWFVSTVGCLPLFLADGRYFNVA